MARDIQSNERVISLPTLPLAERRYDHDWPAELQALWNIARGARDAYQEADNCRASMIHRGELSAMNRVDDVVDALWLAWATVERAFLDRAGDLLTRFDLMTGGGDVEPTPAQVGFIIDASDAEWSAAGFDTVRFESTDEPAWERSDAASWNRGTGDA